MEIPVLNVEYRADTGKNSAHRSRKRGNVPGVIYDPNQNKLIEVDKKELENILSRYGVNALVNIKLGNDTIKTIIKEVQHDPINSQVIHIDFKPVDDNTKVRTHVPIRFVGVNAAERTGGILQRHRQEVEIECAADRVPKYVNVDLSKLSLGQSIKVQDIEFAEELTLLTKPTEVIAALTPPVNFIVDDEEDIEKVEEA